MIEIEVREPAMSVEHFMRSTKLSGMDIES